MKRNGIKTLLAILLSAGMIGLFVANDLIPASLPEWLASFFKPTEPPPPPPPPPEAVCAGVDKDDNPILYQRCLGLGLVGDGGGSAPKTEPRVKTSPETSKKREAVSTPKIEPPSVTKPEKPALEPLKTVRLPGGERLELVLIRPDGRSRQEATISKAYYLGKFEVTQAQWVAVMGDNPSTFKRPNHPVETVSLREVEHFLRRLNEREGHKQYRLPTEAEWAFAARGEEPGKPGQNAWYKEAWNKGSTHAVGSTTEANNPYGLRDMLGNVSEWVSDGAGDEQRIRRGGAWSNQDPAQCTPTARKLEAPDYVDADAGFRLALSVED